MARVSPLIASLAVAEVAPSEQVSNRCTRTSHSLLLRETTQIFTNLVADRPERCETFVFRPFHGCGVVETVVEAVSVAREDRTAFFGVVADGENVIVRPVCELVYALRT